MTFTIIPANAPVEATPVILGITAPSGAGKTLSALRLAHGIQSVVGGTICMIDTEGRRSGRYKNWPGFSYNSVYFDPPFSSARYADAIREVYAAGNKTIIVDSMSHEHEGAGGYLEMHETEIDRMLGDRKGDWKAREKATFTGWIKPAQERRKLINAFLQVPANFIFCFRAKEKIKVVSGGAPIQLGWQAIAGDEFVYEMLARCLLPPGANGIPDWSREAFAHGAAKLDDQDRDFFPVGAVLSENIGRKIATIYAGKAMTPRIEVKEPTAAEKKAAAVEAVKDNLREATEGGVDVLTAAWERLSAQQRQYLQAFYDDELFPAAQAVDATTEEDVI